MASAKKPKVDIKRLAITMIGWLSIFFKGVGNKAACWLWNKNVGMLKEFDVCCHDRTKHAGYGSINRNYCGKKQMFYCW